MEDAQSDQVALQRALVTRTLAGSEHVATQMLAEELRRIVLARGMSIPELVQATGLPPSILQRVLRGQSWLPSRRVISTLLKACHAHPAQVHRLMATWEMAVALRKSEKERPAAPVATERAPRWTTVGTSDRQEVFRDVPSQDDLEPDPLKASTKEEFLQCMRDFQVWAYDPSYGEIVRRSGRRVAVSTLSEALNPNKPARLPSMKVVTAFIIGCGGNEKCLARWSTAWRRIRMGQAKRTTD
ncbi:helix-turn-helix domain-containing protein [Streptosporangium sandarakinum]|uniref:Transcriptional regulator with XRE-family HTH domain n=1 Tax=Streptosporangium sandarakinum TaxID=1260955 RepID=A0A852UM14_9ACTN|nr:helix-turn-helix transcriptional regulator [Streptosporangium sandarakinum]NYF37962.1 transcriptional regulator with XRE-family HTH domain [Streptosporangium sandarakinum]